MNPFILEGTLNDLWKYSNGNWTWISGSNSTDIYGVYGTMGVESTLNYPGSRLAAMSWEYAGYFWLFGGLGYTESTIGN